MELELKGMDSSDSPCNKKKQDVQIESGRVNGYFFRQSKMRNNTKSKKKKDSLTPKKIQVLTKVYYLVLFNL